MGFIKTMLSATALIACNSALAERHQDTPAHALMTMWSSWIQEIKPQSKANAAWPETRKIDTRFHIDTQPAELNLRKGDKVVFTISPAGMSLSSRF
ncbi:hypothetical protein [Zhongshania arctica]|uniref:Copper-binding protein n=1 Tax=Zhongshania arctica TaxID=3238302 RepID=A0ABV3TY75_9GAMM